MRERERDEVTESYNNKSLGTACAWKELRGRWGGGGKKGSWSWLLCAATDSKAHHQSRRREMGEEEGSFPPPLGFSSFLWGCMV
jgi:hypothetical protein